MVTACAEGTLGAHMLNWAWPGGALGTHYSCLGRKGASARDGGRQKETGDGLRLCARERERGDEGAHEGVGAGVVHALDVEEEDGEEAEDDAGRGQTPGRRCIRDPTEARRPRLRLLEVLQVLGKKNRSTGKTSGARRSRI